MERLSRNIQTGSLKEMKKENASLYWTVALFLALSTICVTANKLYPKISDVEDVIAREDDMAVEDKLFYGVETTDSDLPAVESNEMVVPGASSEERVPSPALPVSLQQLTPGKTKYAIRSLSSGRYLDGRNPGMSDPLLSDGSRDPFTDTFLQWIITPLACNPKLHSIRSVSSKQLLDGRNPGLSTVLLSDGNRHPETDVVLQWEMVKLTEITYAIRSKSSGQYLDGRNPDLYTPILSSGDRDPRTDTYLQFLIFPL